EEPLHFRSDWIAGPMSPNSKLITRSVMTVAADFALETFATYANPKMKRTSVQIPKISRFVSSANNIGCSFIETRKAGLDRTRTGMSTAVTPVFTAMMIVMTTVLMV